MVCAFAYRIHVLGELWSGGRRVGSVARSCYHIPGVAKTLLEQVASTNNMEVRSMLHIRALAF